MFRKPLAIVGKVREVKGSLSWPNGTFPRADSAVLACRGTERAFPRPAVGTLWVHGWCCRWDEWDWFLFKAHCFALHFLSQSVSIRIDSEQWPRTPKNQP